MPQKQLENWLTKELPHFKLATSIPQRFNDSTHDLWLLEDSQSTNFLKVCSNTRSPFWQIMEHLFDFDLANEIGNFERLYSFINALTPLQIPTVITAKSAPRHKPLRQAYILTSQLAGSAVEKVNMDMVEQLARHLSSFHQVRVNPKGSCYTLNPLFNKEDVDGTTHQHSTEINHSSPLWSDRLIQTLQTFGLKQKIPKPFLTEAINACQYIDTHDFVPMMPDLRWDQFLQQDGKLTSLVDLDAFVLAPRELDFVLLEYILTAEQHCHFIKAYQYRLPIPDISQVRPAYRLLLFLMRVLGETDIKTWMKHR